MQSCDCKSLNKYYNEIELKNRFLKIYSKPSGIFKIKGPENTAFDYTGNLPPNLRYYTYFS